MITYKEGTASCPHNYVKCLYFFNIISTLETFPVLFECIFFAVIVWFFFPLFKDVNTFSTCSPNILRECYIISFIFRQLR